jgi:hypothetical protein
MENIFGEYFVDESGNVFRRLTPTISKNGYAVYGLRIDGKGRRSYAHRLIAKAFIPNPNDLPEVNHINGIKTDNRIENLEWISREDNMKHAYKLGLKKNDTPTRGNHYKAKQVLDLNSGIYYDSWLDAAEARQIPYYAIANAIKWGRNNTGLISV